MIYGPGYVGAADTELSVKMEVLRWTDESLFARARVLDSGDALGRPVLPPCCRSYAHRKGDAITH
jgi:hypothetical protein